MSRDVNRDIRRIFQSNGWSQCWRSHSSHTHASSDTKFLEVPIHSDVFEVPLFALSTFTDIVNAGEDADIEAIVVSLFCKGSIPRYKSVDRYMKDVLVERLTASRLVFIETKQGDETIPYYGTHGAVFDRHFNPIMVCSYQIESYLEEREAEGETTCGVKYRVIKPILRISRDVFLAKADPIQKYIANKMVNAFLEARVETVPPFKCPKLRFQNSMDFVKIEIDDFPFSIKEVDTPSISTTNEKLLDIALNHQDELIQ